MHSSRPLATVCHQLHCDVQSKPDTSSYPLQSTVTSITELPRSPSPPTHPPPSIFVSVLQLHDAYIGFLCSSPHPTPTPLLSYTAFALLQGYMLESCVYMHVLHVWDEEKSFYEEKSFSKLQNKRMITHITIYEHYSVPLSAF